MASMLGAQGYCSVGDRDWPALRWRYDAPSRIDVTTYGGAQQFLRAGHGTLQFTLAFDAGSWEPLQQSLQTMTVLDFWASGLRTPIIIRALEVTAHMDSLTTVEVVAVCVGAVTYAVAYDGSEDWRVPMPEPPLEPRARRGLALGGFK